MKRLFVVFLSFCMCFVGCASVTDTSTENTANAMSEAPTEHVEENTLIGIVRGIKDDSIMINPIDKGLCDEIVFSIADLEKHDVFNNNAVLVAYRGGIMESYPAQINAISWTVLENDLRDYEYTGEWLNKEDAEFKGDGEADSIVITRIYSNCFFGEYATFADQFKFNGSLGDEWCVGDLIHCSYENAYRDDEKRCYEADFISVRESDWTPQPGVCYKPVIYLYPEDEIEVSVSLTLDGELTCTYPAYGDSWTVTASPDGTLTDKNGQIYNYLYWEGVTNVEYDFSRGFCVKGEDTAAFLEVALERLGLNRREANEFIVYWLPLMELNPYNIISFQTDVYTEAAKLAVVPTPDTVNRVFMAWKASDESVAIPEQSLLSPDREGFTVIEWGGTEVK